ncbi:MAG: class I SAM-dependent methyltransferase [Candidatus Paceibacterales bacterium]
MKSERQKYSFKKYDSKSRWISYWHQINEVLNLESKNILEIGVGNKTVSDCLKNQGIEVVTLDIDEKLNPDVIGNALEIPFPDNTFDVILCAEVLEHLPFEKFERGLRELKRVSKKYVLLSLPHFGHSIKLSFKIPLIKEKKFAIRMPFPIKHHFNGKHYWEIGKRGYPLTKIRHIIKKYFIIKKDFIPFENQYHHFFVLAKG